MANPHLKDIYTRENPLQAMNATAAQIEKETGISVIKAHLGNPTAPQFQPTNELVGEYFKKRHEDPASRGYADVIGMPDWRGVIANALTKINRLPAGLINKDNVRGVDGGTGALNVAFQIFNNPTILVPEPYYPPWLEIAEHTKERNVAHYNLTREGGYLPDVEELRKTIRQINDNATPLAENVLPPVVLAYHYPQNPTGKTLNDEEARLVADRLNTLCHEFPNLYLVQEDLYLATTASDTGIYTPLPHLDENARARTMWINSPSKMGHAQDRGAVIAAFDKDILLHLRGCISFDTLGPSHPSMLATANTLVEIADGGVDARGEPGTRAENYRYQTADYYQSRMQTVADGIRELEQQLNVSIMPDGNPKGAYYLFPDFSFLKNQPVPEELQAAVKKTHFENADDLTAALKNAHLIGLQPITVGSGTLFTHDPGTMSFRFSAIEMDEAKMGSAVNTLKGLVQKSLGNDLGASFYTVDELKERVPAVQAARGVKASGLESPRGSFYITR